MSCISIPAAEVRTAFRNVRVLLLGGDLSFSDYPHHGVVCCCVRVGSLEQRSSLAVCAKRQAADSWQTVLVYSFNHHTSLIIPYNGEDCIYFSIVEAAASNRLLGSSILSLSGASLEHPCFTGVMSLKGPGGAPAGSLSVAVKLLASDAACYCSKNTSPLSAPLPAPSLSVRPSSSSSDVMRNNVSALQNSQWTEDRRHIMRRSERRDRLTDRHTHCPIERFPVSEFVSQRRSLVTAWDTKCLCLRAHGCHGISTESEDTGHGDWPASGSLCPPRTAQCSCERRQQSSTDGRRAPGIQRESGCHRQSVVEDRSDVQHQQLLDSPASRLSTDRKRLPTDAHRRVALPDDNAAVLGSKQQSTGSTNWLSHEDSKPFLFHAVRSGGASSTTASSTPLSRENVQQPSAAKPGWGRSFSCGYSSSSLSCTDAAASTFSSCDSFYSVENGRPGWSESDTENAKSHASLSGRAGEASFDEGSPQPLRRRRISPETPCPRQMARTRWWKGRFNILAVTVHRCYGGPDARAGDMLFVICRFGGVQVQSENSISSEFESTFIFSLTRGRSVRLLLAEKKGTESSSSSIRVTGTAKLRLDSLHREEICTDEQREFGFVSIPLKSFKGGHLAGSSIVLSIRFLTDQDAKRTALCNS